MPLCAWLQEVEEVEQHLAWKLEERTLRIEELRVCPSVRAFRPSRALAAPCPCDDRARLCCTAQEALAKSRRELEDAADWDVEGA